MVCGSGEELNSTREAAMAVLDWPWGDGAGLLMWGSGIVISMAA